MEPASRVALNQAFYVHFLQEADIDRVSHGQQLLPCEFAQKVRMPDFDSLT